MSALPVLAGATLASGVFIAVFFRFRSTAFARARRVFLLEPGQAQLRSELRSTLQNFVVDFVAVSAILHAGLFDKTGGSFLLTLFASIMWFELWFYALHRSLHTKRLYFLHRQHHVARVTSPLSAFSASIGERLLLVGGLFLPVALASRFVPISLDALIAQYVLIALINVYSHSNVELFPAWFTRLKLSKLFASTSAHALHHARHTGHYGHWVTIIDRLLGTEFEDDERVLVRAAEDKGLKSLQERA